MFVKEWSSEHHLLGIPTEDAPDAELVPADAQSTSQAGEAPAETQSRLRVGSGQSKSSKNQDKPKKSPSATKKDRKGENQP